MRIAVVAETFLPQMNGVVNSVIQMLRHFDQHDHEVLLVAPQGLGAEPGPEHTHGAALALLRSVALPSYADVRLTVASVARVETLLRDFAPDVVHVASPFILGWQAIRAAERLGIPTVSIYQTDIPGYAQRYGITAVAPALTRHLVRMHNKSTLTLAPSSPAISELAALGIQNVRPWARGVDAERFSPSKRDDDLRAMYAAPGELIIGYVGRLAPEKQVEDLAAIADIAGTQLVIVGEGPSRGALMERLPNAHFVGFQSGDQLAATLASFDLFVHPGENETFCQTVQESMASGVPVVATGKGGPLDLVHNSRTGWLYPPGDLVEMRARVLDLVGDGAKRRAFGVAARASVENRTWSSLGDELLAHYRDAIALTGAEGASETAIPPNPGAIRRYVAIGDSLTEGLSDSSRQEPGAFRGWADRLASMLALSAGRSKQVKYANLAVRSRRVSDVVEVQIPRAIELRADFVTVLVGANDLVRLRTRVNLVADKLAAGVRELRASGADVMLIPPFAPQRRYLRPLHHRMARFNDRLIAQLAGSGTLIVDFTGHPSRSDEKSWAEDRAHLSSRGHRALAYAAAAALRLPAADELAALEALLHDDEAAAYDDGLSLTRWLWVHARPWLGRRLRGTTAGDGRLAKHDQLQRVAGSVPRIKGKKSKR